MDKLYRQLYEVFKKELIKLNIGYDFDNSTISYMNDLINAVDFISHGDPTYTEAIKIIQRYEQ